MIGKRETVSTQIGSMSLVGIHGSPPHRHGNYFDLMDGTRIWNMWAENLQAADRQFNLGGQVQIIRYSRGAIIDDERIPKEWYYNALCRTGGYGPTLEEAQEIYAYLGDPTNELEQYTDPKSYWAKRGGVYHEGGGVSFNYARSN